MADGSFIERALHSAGGCRSMMSLNNMRKRSHTMDYRFRLFARLLSGCMDGVIVRNKEEVSIAARLETVFKNTHEAAIHDLSWYNWREKRLCEARNTVNVGINRQAGTLSRKRCLLNRQCRRNKKDLGVRLVGKPVAAVRGGKESVGIRLPRKGILRWRRRKIRDL